MPSLKPILQGTIAAALLSLSAVDSRAGGLEDLRVMSGLSPAGLALISAQVAPEAALPSSQNKELFSDYRIRYIVKGRMDFKASPPTLTAETGKVFNVTKYPLWLRLAQGRTVCVEAYARQRDDTAELAIEKVLPPDALEGLEPSDKIRGLQRDPRLASREGGVFTVDNIGWAMEHDGEGAIARDADGNFISVWRGGVRVDASKLLNAYFVKKTALKPVRYGDHGMLMFTFAPGGAVSPDGSETNALVVSLDAYYNDPERMVYSPVDALRGKYQVYYSMQTAERYSELKFNYNEFGMPNDLVLVPYRLNLDRSELERLLENAIAKATDDNKGEMYSLFYNSCANSALSLINSAVNGERKIKEGWLPELVYRTQATLPDTMARLMIKRGLSGEALPDITKDNYLSYLENLTAAE